MGRLTQEDDLGNWKVKGVAWESLHEGQVITKETYEKLYGCLCKLKDYEATGYSPDELSGCSIISSGEYPYWDGYKDGKADAYNKAIDDLWYKLNSHFADWQLTEDDKLAKDIIELAIESIDEIAEELKERGAKMNNRMNVQSQVNCMKDSIVGFRYKHFKGDIYVVTDIAVHSETEEPMVIYKSFDKPNLVWCRPLDMFMSEVDHEKYPSVQQKMRFERIEKDE